MPRDEEGALVNTKDSREISSFGFVGEFVYELSQKIPQEKSSLNI